MLYGLKYSIYVDEGFTFGTGIYINYWDFGLSTKFKVHRDNKRIL